jgi:hypothetical protein
MIARYTYTGKIGQPHHAQTLLGLVWLRVKDAANRLPARHRRAYVGTRTEALTTVDTDAVQGWTKLEAGLFYGSLGQPRVYPRAADKTPPARDRLILTPDEIRRLYTDRMRLKGFSAPAQGSLQAIVLDDRLRGERMLRVRELLMPTGQRPKAVKP